MEISCDNRCRILEGCSGEAMIGLNHSKNYRSRWIQPIEYNLAR